MKLKEKLANPPVENRSLPFWSWNDTLDAEELRHQIREMAKAKVGGYFMHARSGLKTAYLDEPWFESIEIGIQEGHKEGLLPWAYDEEGWPSGFAGGKVTSLGDAYHARGLRIATYTTQEDIPQDEKLLGIFAYTKEYAHTYPLEAVPEGVAVEGYVVMTHSVSPYYIDILNPITTEAFIKETHDAYLERFGSDMPEGFFTDEPRLSEGPIPWSYILPEEFSNDHGYDLMKHLPALYLPSKGYEQVRTDFWRTVSRLFVHSYMEQLYTWCEQNQSKLTGHMMMEESLYSQMTGTSGSMPFYPFFHMPGIDSLRRQIHDPRMPKQVSSVAEQLGKKRVLSESFALSGWDVNFEELRWIMNWQFVNGVNIICQHLEAYSLKGFRKRDYPPSLFIQQTWWDEYYRFNDYMARLSTLLIEGKKQVEVLLLHPMHTGWITYDGTNNPTIQEYDKDFSGATMTLSGLHIDYHLGDETIMAEHGTLADGMLKIGDYQYQHIVLPSMLSLDKETAEVLIQFSEQGGNLYCMGTFPTLVSGREDALTLNLLRSKAIPLDNDKAILSSLKGKLEHQISLTVGEREEKSLHYCLHQQEGTSSLFIVNNSKTEGFDEVTITFNKPYAVSILDLETNIQSPLSNGTLSLVTSFEPMEGKVYLLEKREREKTHAPTKGKTQTIIKPSGIWDITHIDENLLTLDTCAYRIDNGPQQEPKAVIRIMKELLQLKRPCEIELSFSFSLEADPAFLGPLSLVIEESKHFTILINGKKAGDAQGFYKDRAFEKIDITDLVKRGDNNILITSTFYQSEHVYKTLFGDKIYETELNKLTYDMELESIYLLGNFSAYSKSGFVKGEREALETEGPFFIKGPLTTLRHESFTEQGLLFFAGVIDLQQTFVMDDLPANPVVLDLGRPRVQMAQLWVNDTLVKTFLWAPWKTDITAYVKQGTNKVRLKFFASNRNMLGPHHHISGENYSVGPQSFEGVFSWCERPTEAVAIDRSMEKKSFWKDSYTFVRFGF